MAAFWQGLTGQTYGASFDKEPMTREELLSEAREREAEMAAAAPNPNSSDAGKADNRAARPIPRERRTEENARLERRICECMSAG